MKMKRVRNLIWFVLIWPVLMEGQELSVTAEFDTSRIYIGDQIDFSIVVEQPAGMKVKIPVFRDSLNRNIEILSGPSVDSTVIPGNRLRINTRYLVTSFDSGLYHVAPVYAEINDATGIKRFYSDYSILEVTRVRITPPDTASRIFDIIEPYKAPLTFEEILPWVLLLIAAGLLVWLAVRFAPRLRRTPKVNVTPVKIEAAHVIAFRELEKLREEKLWQKGEIKKYYTRLTEILRQYLEDRFQVYSLELTTSETLEALLRTGFKKDATYNNLKTVLNGADLVKFARYKPEPAENESGFDLSWDFVQVTKKEEIPVENAEQVIQDNKEAGI